MVIVMRAPRVDTLPQAKFYLNVAKITGNAAYVDAVVDFFMRSDVECPIAEYLSIASTYLKYGKKDKAVEIIEDVLEFIGSGCKKDKYNNAETTTEKPGGDGQWPS